MFTRVKGRDTKDTVLVDYFSLRYLWISLGLCMRPSQVPCKFLYQDASGTIFNMFFVFTIFSEKERAKSF